MPKVPPIAAVHVYWANLWAGAIGPANLDGTGADQNFITGADVPRGLAVDANHVYWTNPNLRTIGRANLDVTGVDQKFITTGQTSHPFSVAVDANHLYWADGSGNTIGRANLDGTGVNPSFITNTNAPVGVAVDSTHVIRGREGTVCDG
jgi:streptogramin lyase